MDEYVYKIGELILRCRKVIEREWDLLSIVFDTGDTHIAHSGFLYKGKDIDTVTARIDDEPLLLSDTILEFREKVFENSGCKFKQLLIQMEKKTGQIKMDFEFDNAQRWVFTPAKLKEVKESLRPKFN